MTELIVDNFAGGGGASIGIELATGRSLRKCCTSSLCRGSCQGESA